MDNTILQNNSAVNAVITMYPNIKLQMMEGISRMPTDRTKYHTTQHVFAMLKCLDEEYTNEQNQKFFQDLPLQNLRDVLIAICWHDVVCIPGYQYNELRSAAEWTEYAKKADLIFSAFNVADMINSTQFGFNINMIKLHPDWALLHDLDYMSFASYPAMVVNRNLIRNEFDFLSDLDYANGRIKFLESLLNIAQTSGVFLTPVFRKYNEAALEDIRREYNSYKRLKNQFMDNLMKSFADTPECDYQNQQHEDITLDFFMRMVLIMDDLASEETISAFNTIVSSITARIQTEGFEIHAYPSIERVINLVKNAPEETRAGVIKRQVATAIERIETYQSLMDTKDDEYIITGEEDGESDC